MSADHELWMSRAIELAKSAEKAGEVPVGAVIVRDNQIIGEGYNQPIGTSDPTAHAEIMALRDAAGKEGNYRLPDSTLYVTIEPCTMCVGAMIHARIGTIVFGAREPRAGALVSNLHLHEQHFYNHRPSILDGILAEECSQLISDFFTERRSK